MFRIISCSTWFLVIVLSAVSSLDADHVAESPREIPIADNVDVVVVGGSGGAVAAASEAARQGARVFLLAPRPHLGTDICSTLRLWLEEKERPKSKLAVACFGSGGATTPLKVKAEMDKALLESGVQYLTGCLVTDVLRDEDGRIAGVVMANRSGRQAVKAKVVVDATRQAVVARQAGVAFRPFVPGPQVFARVVAGGDMKSGDSILTAERKPFTYDSVMPGTSHRLPVYEYTLRIDVQSNSLDSSFDVEHKSRDITYDEQSEMGSEVLRWAPTDTIVGAAHLDDWPGAEQTELGPFRTGQTPYLYVLSPYADLGREATGKLMRPLELMEMGTRIGRAAARESAARPLPVGVVLPETATSGAAQVDVRENLDGIRWSEHGTICAGARDLPVLGRYDVVVVGGGTSGAPAGIAAAKSGAKTLVIEYLYELGGVGTVGLIAKYWYGLRRGYTQYVDEQVNHGKDSWNAVAKAEWLRRELLASGADVWFGTLGCGAVVDGSQVRGIVVATPRGRGVVLATTVVDATGNADIAASAGAATQHSISHLGALNVQIAGFPERPLKRSYVNTCYTMVDDTDVLDVWHLMVWKRLAARKAASFDIGQLIDSRERRRIVGDYVLTVEDILNRRTFPDTISQHYSNFDAAAFPDSHLLLVSNAKGPCFHTDLPYRCLLPKDLDGILVVGLGASAQRDAMTLIRMQADLQNQGYAAGLAAAEAAKLNGRTRSIDVKAVQKRLIAEGGLDERVSTDTDSYPMSVAAIERAVLAMGEPDSPSKLGALAVIMAHPEQAIPRLKTQFRESSAEGTKLDYARLLAILGDPTGAPALIAAIDAHDGWDPGAALTSQRKTGNTFSDLDRLVIALGLSGAPRAREPLLRKLGQLEPDSELSHYKAIALALRGRESSAAADSLAKLLDRPGFAGHATLDAVVRRQGASGAGLATVADRFVTAAGDKPANTTNLNRAFKELIVAAMLYRCGDRDGRAESILEQYARDIHGHFARYASWTLRGTDGQPDSKE